jgi:crotonobetainyl-CoA:carnitine CoA-transferase CaiB-like acyl-CoA transferase
VHLSKDPLYSTNGARVKNREAITHILNDIFLKRTTREWVKMLDEAGVANGPINNVAQVFEEPQVLARGMKIELPHAVAGTVPLVGSPMKFSDTPIKHEIPPPALGQHTDEILLSVLKKSQDEVTALKTKGIV